ncbi:MAG: hypothetical protein ACHQAY_12775 [Hyphomicrobiales bacterium]
MSDSPNRSYEKIMRADLKRLQRLALGYFNDLFDRKPEGTGRLRNHLAMLCLVQGAAEHYVRGLRGVRDFDILAIFREVPDLAYPARLLLSVDYGPSKFGSDPDEPWLTGRKVDLVGRSIEIRLSETPVESVQRYLAAGRTESSRLWAQRPLVALWPTTLFPKVVWDKGQPQTGLVRC